MLRTKHVLNCKYLGKALCEAVDENGFQCPEIMCSTKISKHRAESCTFQCMQCPLCELSLTRLSMIDHMYEVHQEEIVWKTVLSKAEGSNIKDNTLVDILELDFRDLGPKTK